MRLAALIAMKNGHSFSAVQEAGKGAVASVTSAIFILFAVGALIGVWNLSGTIPTLVYYGIQILSPGWFYAATAIICGIVALSIGSSWTTAATIGVGLVGIATLIGVSPAITAGAVISGAYLGDKTSPLSETTVLTAQIVGVDVHEHIKRQVWTSVPAFLIALAVFLVLSVTGAVTISDAEVTSELNDLNEVFWITPLALLPLVLLAVLSIKKVPASLALIASTLFAGVLGAFLQPDVYADFVAGTGNVVVESIKAVWTAMANGFSIDTGIPDVDRLLSRGGMDSMLLTIWLILGAVTFGAMLEEFGLISRLIDPMIAAATSTGRLFLTVFACGFGLNVVAGDQYIALVLPSRIFKAEFAQARPRADQPVPARRRQRHRDLAAGAVELLRRVHGRHPRRLDAALPAVRGVLLRQPRAERAVRLHRIPHREDGTDRSRGERMTTQTEAAPGGAVAKMSVPTLTAMVVGGMVGAGVFSLPARFGVATGILGSLIAWAVAGAGMLMLAFVFQNLAIRKPDLDSGVFIYAKAGFGDYAGFNSAIGFWASSVAGNTFYWVFIMATIGAFWDGLGDGATFLAVALSTVGVWLFHILIARGVRDAAVINRIVTIFKILPILTFIVVLFFYFDPQVFADNWTATGYGDLGGLNEQVRNTMLITTFVFIGIEGASVYSRYAKRREDVGKATVLGFLSVLAIFALVTTSSYAVVPQPELAATRQPSMVGVFESVVGDWGEIFISVAVVVSVLGAYLAWTLMAAEVMYIPARADDFPEFLGRENEQRHADHRPRDDLARRPGAAAAHARRQRRAQLHAGPVHQPGADPVLPGGGVRPQARPHR